MEGILKLLRKLGYSEDEIKTVLNKVPVNQEGLMGTNVATGIFSKPKEGKLAKDFLVSDVIGNPFEIDYYKGRSREDILKSAEAQLNMINDELLKISYQIVNKNLKLTDDQLRNFSKNLEAKRRFEKDFETFKTKPEAEVLNIGTGKKVEDIETLKEKSGLIASPTTDLGRIDLRNKQMLQKADEFFKSQEEVEKAEAKRQALIAKQYEGKGYAGGTFGPSGMYRSVARDFLLDQNAKGIIKLDSGVVKALEDRAYISGGQPLMYPDPIRVMRFHYGDDVFEKIPLDKIKTGAKSEILDAMSKVEANPVKIESPMTPGGYMTPGEIKANIEELENIERMIKRREYRFADMTDEQIKNELEHYGSQKNAFEIAFGYDHPKEYKEYLKLNNPEEYYKAKEMEKITPLNEPSKPYKPFGSDFTKQEKVDWLIKNVDQEAKVTIPSPEFLQNMLDSGRGDLIDHFWEIHTKNIGSKPVIDIDTSNLKNPALVRAMMEERASKPKLVYSKEKTVKDSVDDAGKVNKDDPEKFAKGGSVGSKGLDYLTGQEPPKNGYAGGGRIGYAEGSDEAPSITLDTYEKASDNEIFGSKLPETKSGLRGLYYGFKEDQRPVVIDPNTGKPIDSGNLKDLKKVFSSLLSDSKPEIGYATDKFNVGASKGINPFGDKSLRYGASYYPDKDQTFFLDAGPDYKTAGYLYKPNEAGSISLTGSKGSLGDKNFFLKGEYNFAGGGRVNLQKGSIPKILEFLIDKLSKEKNFNKTLLEKSSPKAIQDLYIEKYGSLPSAEEIKDIVNKQLQNKGSMEITNPKTGEVTTPKNPIMTVEDLQFKHKDAFKAHDQINIDIGDKIAPDMIAESMAEMKGKDYFSLSQKEQSDLYKKALAYVDDVRMTKRQNKSLYVKGDVITEENFGNTPFAPDLSGLEEARKMTKGMSLHDEMNMVLNQYDKSMFIKNEQGMVDVANPENVKKMALLLRRDHPELYKKLEEGTYVNTLEDFDVTGRKPNAKGGLNYLMGF